MSKSRRVNDSPQEDLRELDSWFEEVYDLQPRRVTSTPTAKAILRRDDAGAVAMIRAYVVKLELLHRERTSHEFMHSLSDQLLKRELPFSEDDLIWFAERTARTRDFWEWPLTGMVLAIERYVARHRPSDKLRSAVVRMRANIEQLAWHKAERDLIPRLRKLAGESEVTFTADPGEPWAKKLQKDVAAMNPALRDAWTALLAHAQKCTSSKPSLQWMAEAKRHVQTVGVDEFLRRTSAWFALFARLRTDNLPAELSAQEPELKEVWRYDVSVPNGLLLKGLIWIFRAAPDPRHKPVLQSLRKECLSITPFGKRFAEGATACKRVLGELG